MTLFFFFWRCYCSDKFFGQKFGAPPYWFELIRPCKSPFFEKGGVKNIVGLQIAAIFSSKLLKSLASSCLPCFQHKLANEESLFTIETANVFTYFYLLFHEVHGLHKFKLWEGAEVIDVHVQ